MTELREACIALARAAGAAILDVYARDFSVEAKDDDSPLTQADLASHRIICEGLRRLDPAIPVLSEEAAGIAWEERRTWSRYWLVDPLDGTKEFIKRNGEFTVNIALIRDGKPVMGVVAVPVTGDVYYADADGAFVRRKGSSQATALERRTPADLKQSGLRVVASRSHMSDETQAFVGKLQAPTLVSKGSSLKFILVADGEADLYPRYAPTMEWDTAAAHAIVNAVGLRVMEYGKDTELRYNKEDLLNPWFLVG